MMTVAQIIEKLQKLSPDMPVYLDAGRVKYLPCDDVGVQTLVKIQGDTHDQLTYDDQDLRLKGSRVEVVVIG